MTWTDRALCAEVGGEFWFPEKGGRSESAMAVCEACPVRQKCLDYALEMDENPPGIWGGTTFLRRRKMRQEAA